MAKTEKKEDKKVEKARHWFRTDKVVLKEKEGWKKVEGNINPDDLVLMEK